jgi:hypothetical protein
MMGWSNPGTRHCDRSGTVADEYCPIAETQQNLDWNTVERTESGEPIAIPDALFSTLSGIYDVLNSFAMLSTYDDAIYPLTLNDRSPAFLLPML